MPDQHAQSESESATSGQPLNRRERRAAGRSGQVTDRALARRVQTLPMGNTRQYNHRRSG